MSPIQFFRILWARRLIVLVAVLSCLVAAIIGGTIMPARYKATSRVMLDIVKPDPVTGEMIASGFARAYVNTQVELIRDYRVAGPVADAVGWTSSPQMAAQYEARSSDDTRDFRRWVAQRIIDNTDTRLIEGSNILEINFTSPNAETAAEMADAIREAFVKQALAFKRDDAITNANWFRQQTDKLRLQLKVAETRKADFERANGVILDASNNDQESARLAAMASTAGPATGPMLSAPNPVAAQLAQADATIASAEKVLGPNNPDLLNMKRHRDAIAQAARAAAPTVVSGGGPSVAALYGAQQAKVLAQRGKVDEARQLAVDVAVLRDQYQKNASRLADLQQQSESNLSGLTVLGSAVAPQTPDFPKWPLLIFGSLGLGFVLGVLVALLIELLSRRVRGIEDLRHHKIPVLGMMTVSRPAKRRWRLFRLPAFLGRERQAEFA